MKRKTLICVVGPTAVGKTETAIELAQWVNAEILSADSRQFYREMEIGTAKPDSSELDAAKHHFINNLSIQDTYDVGLYEEQVLTKLDELFLNNDFAILVGGSGMFVDAICQGLDQFPDVPIEIREQLKKELNSKGIEPLQKELKLSDLDYYQEVDRNNPQRVIRALEVIRTTGQKFSSFRKGSVIERPFNTVKIGLEMDREKLYERINLRMDLMIQAGLFEEAESLIEHRSLNALQTVGYREIFGCLDGDYDKEEAIRLLKRNSRRYAKRQMTWFKRDEETSWFNPSQSEEIKSYLKSKLELSITKD